MLELYPAQGIPDDGRIRIDLDLQVALGILLNTSNISMLQS